MITDCMSDHFPRFVSLELTDSCERPVDMYLEKRKIKEDVLLKIQQKLLFHDWSALNTCGVNEGYSILDELIRHTLSLHQKIKSDDRFLEPWLTVSIKKCNLKCKKLCNKAKQTGVLADLENYKCYRNSLNRI